jgi:L-erythro-3,5-diaminohexanoate dehydrogenase
MRVLVLGAGKSGALVLARARELLAGTGEAVAADLSPRALEAVARAGLCDGTLQVDATDAVATLAAVEGAGGPFDLVVNCASVPGTELASLLAVKDGGTVLFFSMATSFTAAALGAEGIGKDATLLVGNGYVPGHAELTLDLVRRNAGLRALLQARYGGR